MRAAARGVEALVAGATSRRPLRNADGKSGALLESVVLDGEPYVVKVFDVERDWLLRASGDAGCRAVALWEHGLYDAVPATVDHTVVGAAREPGSRRAALLMRDVSPWLVPEDAPVALADHRAYLDAMAAVHAAFWGWRDDLGLIPMSTRYLLLSPLVPATEAAYGVDPLDDVPAMVGPAWAAFATAVPPDVATLVAALLADPWPLVEALAATPWTFLPGDWKYGNMGRHPDGRTILLDWDRPGAGPATFDLTWYLAVNTDRLPEPKEAAADAYRASLESYGVDTGAWWDRQYALALLGAYVQLGWSKTGQPGELAWWSARARDAIRWM
jgi:hypothetical protein